MDRLEAGDPGQVGPFRLVGRLGEGGMGRVFLGQSRGGRKVAVKVMHPVHARDPEFHRRFAREVAAARQVGGFHTAVVVDADPDADPPWMATAYVAGPSLAEAVAQRGPLDEAGARELGAALAEGLVAIHDCGLIHRDLKPSNVIMADDGPRIIDFGIAKDADSTALTNSGVVIGTLRYMSPEQLQGHQLTPQSDVFALGAVLAFASTGHDPFQGPTIPSVITGILTGPPDLDPLAGDLRRIIGDCLAKAPGDRPSPSDLLGRFGHPAPTVSPGAPAPADGGRPAGTAAGLSLAGTVGMAPAQWTGPEPAGRKLPRRTGLIAAGAAAVVGLVVVGSLWLTNGPPPGPPTVLTDPGSDTVQSIAFGPGGVLAAGGSRGTTYLWNTTTGKITATLTDPASQGVKSVAFGPGGVLAAGDENGSTYLWNTATGKITATLTTAFENDSVDSVAFGPGGVLATGDGDGGTYLWNTTTGDITATLADPDSLGVQSVAFGSGGTLATGDEDGSIYLWNTTTDKTTDTFTDPAGDSATSVSGINSVAFGPGGVLAAGDEDGSTYLWNIATGKITATLTDPPMAIVASVAFGPGDTLAAGDASGSAYLWNTTTDQITATLNASDSPSRGFDSVAFGPGSILAGAAGNGSTYLLRPKQG